MRKVNQGIGYTLVYLSVFIVFLAFIAIFVFVIVNGASVLSPGFILEFPRRAMTEGGIFPAIVGTVYLSLGAIAFALPLGIITALYLREYAHGNRWVGIIRLSINNLAGVPSVVFGLFGLAIFVKLFGFGVSILSGSLTLGILILPIIIRASEEAIDSVPNTFKEASFALGATKWETIIRIVLPGALPGILTGAIISIGRAAGETAPILFTAATFYTRYLPDSVFSEVMALPYHIYALMSEGTNPGKQVPIAYGTALVLIALVFAVNLGAVLIRARIRRRRRW